MAFYCFCVTALPQQPRRPLCFLLSNLCTDGCSRVLLTPPACSCMLRKRLFCACSTSSASVHHTVPWRVQVYFPVFLEGANLSMGDMHFSQGDGEVSLCSGLAARVSCCPRPGGLLSLTMHAPAPVRGAHKLAAGVGLHGAPAGWHAHELLLPVTPPGLPAAKDTRLCCTACISAWLQKILMLHPVQVSFCGGIEMSGFLHLKAEILRGGMDQYLTPMGPR